MRLTTGQKYRVCFFFDYGAGGCLWADNELTRQTFGLGPVDYAIAKKMNKPDTTTLQLIDSLDIWHVWYYKNNLPTGVLFQQTDFGKFNKALDTLLASLRQQLEDEFEIIDSQERFIQSDMVEEYQATVRTGGHESFKLAQK